MGTYLDGILDWHRARALADDRPVSALVERARTMPPTRRFEGVLREAAGRTGGVAVVAEIKRRSPSQGPLAEDVVAGPLAQAFERGGAACLSVLTDGVHFGGSSQDLMEARAVTALPVLRKDFTVWEGDIADARLMGADAVLLIVAAMRQSQLLEMVAVCHDVRIDPLVECHDEAEIERALAVGATMLGINQRDLTTFQVDGSRAARLSSLVPDHVLKVAESGIGGAEDCRRLADSGFHAVLVGEHLVRSADPVAALRALTGA